MSLIFLVFLVTFVSWRRKQLNMRLRDLVHVPTLIPALIMVTFWFALALRQHGITVFRLMFHDQVVERIDKPTNPLKNLGTYLGGTAAEFLPWTLFLPLMALRLRVRWSRLCAIMREPLLMAACWYVLVVAIVMFSWTCKVRYLLIVYPMLAAAFAGGITFLSRDKLADRNLRVFSEICLYIVAVMGLALGLTGIRIGVPLIAIAGATQLALAIVSIWWCRGNAIAALIAIATLFSAAYRCNVYVIREYFFPSPVPSMVDAIHRQLPSAEKLATYGFPQNDTAAQLRLCLAGKIKVVPLRSDVDIKDLRAYQGIVIEESRMTPQLAENFDKFPAGYDHRMMKDKEMFKSLYNPKARDEYFAKRQNNYLLLIPKKDHQPASQP